MGCHLSCRDCPLISHISFISQYIKNEQRTVTSLLRTTSSNLNHNKKSYRMDRASESTPLFANTGSADIDSSGPNIFKSISFSRSLSFFGGSTGSGTNSIDGSPKFIPLKASTRSLSFRGGGGTSTGVLTNSNVLPIDAWIVPALTCALSYALYNIAIKKASNGINPVLGSVILQSVAALLGFIIYLTERNLTVKDINSVEVVEASGLVWSVAAGVFVGIAEILSFFVNGKGVPATQSIPVIVGGSVFLGTILGRVLLHESVSYRGWIGVFFITFGIGLVSMEPGSKSH